MDDALVIFEDGVFFLGERIRLQCDCEMVIWGGRGFEDLGFGFVNPLDKIEDIMPSPFLCPASWVETSCFPSIRIPDDVVIEAVDGLALILGGLELG